MTDSKYGKYVVTELKTPDFPTEFVERYKEFATRILWMDENVVPGAFQMNCSWYLKPNADHLGGAQKHDEGEIIGFFSSDHTKPYDLGAEVEFWLEDEKYLLTRSCLLFIPGGMKHCPIKFIRIDRPIFHFIMVAGGEYTERK